MAKIDEITLVSTELQQDPLLQWVPSEIKHTVLCQIGSISAQEFFEAGRSGLRAQFRVSMFAPDYAGETIVEYGGKRYGVYRTYLAKDDTIELYLEGKAGA